MKKLLLCFFMSGFYIESFASFFSPKTKKILKYSAIIFTVDTICHSIQYGTFRRRHYSDYTFQFLHKKIYTQETCPIIHNKRQPCFTHSPIQTPSTELMNSPEK
jgi:hypothetical protein